MVSEILFSLALVVLCCQIIQHMNERFPVDTSACRQPIGFATNPCGFVKISDLLCFAEQCGSAKCGSM